MIMINGRFLLHQVTGVERFAGELIAELDAFAKKGEIELVIPPGVPKERTPSFRNIKVVQAGKLGNRLWEHISFPLYVRRKKGLALNLCNTAPLPAPGIVCICDAKTRARPEFFSRKFLLWYRLLMWNETRRAKRIITISEFSRKELCRYYHLSPKQISVIPCAWQHFERIRADETAPAAFGLEEKKYFFAMSSLEPNKNLDWIRRAARQNPAYTFAIAGKMNAEVFSGTGEKSSEMPGKKTDAQSVHARDTGNVRLLGYVSDEAAKGLMSHSAGFLYPSFYEGFGIPPLEALSAGTNPVFVSDTEVMHEVFGEAVTYVDPAGSGEELAGGREAKAAAVAGVLEKYSWKRSAYHLYRLLQKMQNAHD